MRHKYLSATLLAGVLIACEVSPARAPAAAPPPTPRYQPQAPEHQGGTLVMADFEAPGNLDPIHATTASALRVSSLLFAPLWGHDPDLLTYPDLVREVPTIENRDVRVAADGRSMTVLIKLVPGLRWSDGQPLTVDDVMFTVDAICADGSGARDTSGFDHIVAQEKKSPTELLWRFGPRPAGSCNLTAELTSGLYPALELLGPRTRVVPRHRLADIPVTQWPGTPFFRHPEASSGPFAFKASVASDVIDLQANPRYTDGRSAPGIYGASRVKFDHSPRLDAVIYRFYNSRASLLAGLKAGESDLGFHLSPEDAVELRTTPASETVISASLQGEFLNPNHGINTETKRAPPWVNDQPVLDALRLALDRQVLSKAVFRETAVVARSLFPDAMRAYRQSDALPRPDLAAAGQLLDEDGWKLGAGGVRVKAGRRLEFTLLIPCGSAIRAYEQQELVRQLAAAGFAVGSDCRPRARFFASFLDHGVNATGAFDMSLYSNTWQPDPSAWAPFGISSQIPSAGSPGGQNWNRCADPVIDQAFAAGAATMNYRARRQAYLDGATAWLRYGCTIPLLDWPAVVQRTTRLHNFVPDGGDNLDTWNAADWWLPA